MASKSFFILGLHTSLILLNNESNRFSFLEHLLMKQTTERVVSEDRIQKNHQNDRLSVVSI